MDNLYGNILINLRYCFSEDPRKLPNWRDLYEGRFRTRRETIRRTSDIGWGYGDAVQEVLAELER